LSDSHGESRHSCESSPAFRAGHFLFWIPAFAGTTFPLSITRLLSNRTLFLAPDMHPFDKSHARCMKSIAYTANWNESVALGL